MPANRRPRARFGTPVAAYPVPPSPAARLATPLGTAVLATVLATVLALVAGCAGPPPPEGPARRAARAEPVWDTRPSSIAAIGDSITRAFDACSVLSDCPEVSWATGTDAAVESLARQLLGDVAAVRDTAWNLAETGATAADLPAQARAATAYAPELVTVLIGANDACAPSVARMTPVAEFRRDVAKALDIIREELPETQVYVSSVPDLHRLWSEASGYDAALRVWRLANVCPSMLSQPTARDPETAARRHTVRERVRAYNAVLEQVCATDTLCRFDGGAVFDYRFSAAHLSDWDWFHPSREGQRELAALAYQQVTAKQRME